MTTHDFRPSDIIYGAGHDTGHLLGRIATLRLVYIGAACAEELYEATAWRWHHLRNEYEPEMRDRYFALAEAAEEAALATLNVLASLGDETAIGLLAERP